jgi:hypothetical protein
MNAPMQSRFGRALYEALPEVYRTRDGLACDKGGGEGHLAAYLDSCGKLLDVIYNSLDQRYKDCFPETCQEWLLPYFAELLGTTALSPHLEGRREEIMHAVAWRQGKGTLRTIEEIARKIGGFETLLVQEGWKRVARTANIDSLFVSPEIVDLHKKSPKDFAGHRNTAPHSVDVRKPSWLHGHANPYAILLYVLPFSGFFAGGEIVNFQWKNVTVNGSQDIDSWFDTRKSPVLPSELMGLEYDGKENAWFFYKKPGVKKIIHIGGNKELKPAARYRFAELNLDGSLTVPTGAYLVLEKLAAREIHVNNNTTNTPLSGLIANDCLLKAVHAPNSFVQLAYCTVLDEMFAELLKANGCIFMEALYKNGQKKNPSPGEIRYSRHSQEEVFGRFAGNTMETPVFYSQEWGKPDCGVMHSALPESIRYGAEDGGEMGAFHHRTVVLAWEAVIRKLADYLPAGMNVALIPDETLV